ncbi:hypothetical protein [Actinokineospora sp.]|uniref:hypothetical protein n=1 Tax=Actinokineospora sp. TaxID=1872133 RepID=UPI004037DB99
MTKLRGRSVALLTGLGVVSVVAFLVLTPTDHDEPGRADVADLRDEVIRFTSTLREDPRYRPPDAAESTVLADAVRRLGTGAPVPAIADEVRPLGYALSTGTDPDTGRPYALLANEPDTERGWGLYIVDLSRPARLVVEVPHPVNDLGTPDIGLELFRQTPGAVLAVAGTHRRAANGAGDVAHRTDSMFHAVAETLAARGLPQIQLHGFDDATQPDADIVLSPGASDVTSALRTAADRMSDAGLDVCRAWTQNCEGLEGRRNQQGRAAADLGASFIHVEMSRTVRDDRDRWSKVVRALHAADFAGGA